MQKYRPNMTVEALKSMRRMKYANIQDWLQKLCTNWCTTRQVFVTCILNLPRKSRSRLRSERQMVKQNSCLQILQVTVQLQVSYSLCTFRPKIKSVLWNSISYYDSRSMNKAQYPSFGCDWLQRLLLVMKAYLRTIGFIFSL